LAGSSDPGTVTLDQTTEGSSHPLVPSWHAAHQIGRLAAVHGDASFPAAEGDPFIRSLLEPHHHQNQKQQKRILEKHIDCKLIKRKRMNGSDFLKAKQESAASTILKNRAYPNPNHSEEKPKPN